MFEQLEGSIWSMTWTITAKSENSLPATLIKMHYSYFSHYRSLHINFLDLANRHLFGHNNMLYISMLQRFGQPQLLQPQLVVNFSMLQPSPENLRSWEKFVATQWPGRLHQKMVVACVIFFVDRNFNFKDLNGLYWNPIIFIICVMTDSLQLLRWIWRFDAHAKS